MIHRVYSKQNYIHYILLLLLQICQEHREMVFKMQGLVDIVQVFINCSFVEETPNNWSLKVSDNFPIDIWALEKKKCINCGILNKHLMAGERKDQRNTINKGGER